MHEGEDMSAQQLLYVFVVGHDITEDVSRLACMLSQSIIMVAGCISIIQRTVAGPVTVWFCVHC